MAQRRAGLITLRINGVAYDAKGSFTYNLGLPKREAIVGSDGVHGFKEMPQVAFIEGEITDRLGLDVKLLMTGEGLTVTLELNNGKVVVLTEAWSAMDGNVETEEGNIEVRFESGNPGQEF